MASHLVRSIREGKHLPIKRLSPELNKLEGVLDGATQWSYGSVDPEQDRAAVRQSIVGLYSKWLALREDL
jgi:hypothetical protein